MLGRKILRSTVAQLIKYLTNIAFIASMRQSLSSYSELSTEKSIDSFSRSRLDTERVFLLRNFSLLLIYLPTLIGMWALVPTQQNSPRDSLVKPVIISRTAADF